MITFTQLQITKPNLYFQQPGLAWRWPFKFNYKFAVIENPCNCLPTVFKLPLLSTPSGTRRVVIINSLMKPRNSSWTGFLEIDN